MHTTIAALAVAASLVAGAASAAPVHVGFSGLPTASGPSLTYEDVTITGSDTVYNLYL